MKKQSSNRGLSRLLTAMLVVLMGFGVVTLASNSTKADATPHTVEVVRGYGYPAPASEKATQVIQNVEDTGYSLKGTNDGTAYTSASNASYRYGQSCAANNNVKSVDIYYGSKSLTVTGTSGGAVSVYVDGSGNLTTTSTGNTQLLAMASLYNAKKTTTTTYYCRFVGTISADLTIVLHYWQGDKAITFNNVDAISTATSDKLYTQTNKVAVYNAHYLGSARTYFSDYSLEVTPITGKTIESIDVVYAGKYSVTITDFSKALYFDKATTMTASTESAYTGFSFSNNTFSFKEIASTWTITYNYEKTITFNANGGLVDSAETKDVLTSSYKVASLPTPTRTHATDPNIIYAFDGWWTEATGGTQITVETEFSADQTVYAHWKNNYKVTFKANGGQFADSSVDDIIAYTDSTNFTGKLSSIPSAKKSVVISSTTYYPLGWYDGSDPATATKVTVNENTVYSADTTLYIGWTDTTYTITFDYATLKANDSTTVGTGMTVTKPSPNPSVNGYVFVGWYTDNTYTAEFDFENTEITAATTIYAKFDPTYAITVENAYGTDEKVIATATSTDFATFGNSTASIAKGKTGTMTISAIHGTIKDVEVTYGSTKVTFSSTDLVTNTKTLYLTSSKTVSETAGTDDILSISYNASPKGLTVNFLKVEDTVNISLQYNKVTVTFKNGTETYDTQNIDFGSKATKPAADPEKEKHVFNYWYGSSESNEVDFDDAILDDVTYTAKFTPVHTITIIGAGSATGTAIALPSGASWAPTDDAANGGTAHTGTFDATNCVATIVGDFHNKGNGTNAALTIRTSSFYATKVTLTYKGVTVTMTGAECNPNMTASKTYYIQADGTKSTGNGSTSWLKWVNNKNSASYSLRFLQVEGDITITIEHAQVTFDANGGMFGTETTKTVDVTTSKVIDNFANQVPSVVPTNPNGGSTIFGGWYTDLSSESTKVSATTTFTAASTTLKAKWIYQKKVTFDAQGGTYNPSITAEYAYTNENGKLLALPTVNSTKTVGQTTYYFLSWVDENSAVVTTDTVFTEDTTIYASWTDSLENIRTITYNYAGAKSEAVEYMPKGTVPTQPADPTLDGFTFAGWYNEATFDTAFDWTAAVNTNTTAYAKFTTDVKFYNGASEFETQTVTYGSKLTKPVNNPTSGELLFDKWCKESTLENEWVFDTDTVTTATSVYAKFKYDEKVITFVNFYHPLNEANAEIKPVDTFDVIDHENHTVTFNGAYHSTTGKALNAYLNGYAESITIAIEGVGTATLDADFCNSTSAKTVYLKADGTLGTTEDKTTDIAKIVHNSNAASITMRFYNVATNITYTANYKNNLTVTLDTTDSDAYTSYSFDMVTPNSTVVNNVLTIGDYDLTGQDGGFVRVAMAPGTRMIGLKIEDGVEEETVVFNAGNAAKSMYATKFGYVALAQASGIYYVKFGSLKKSVTIKPIMLEVDPSTRFTVSLVAPSNVPVLYTENLPKDVKVAKNNRSFTTKYGSLTSKEDGESFRWSLGSTAGMDYEFYKLEVVNADTKVVIATLGEDIISYKDAKAAQTKTASLEGITIIYNKSKYNDAQIRVYNITKNIELVLYMKNYTTSEVVRADSKDLSLVYDGILTIDPNGSTVEIVDEEKAPKITLLKGTTKIRYNDYVAQTDGVKFYIKNTNLGENIDYVTVEVEGEQYILGKDVLVGKAEAKQYPGVKVMFARVTDGYIQIRVYAVSNDVKIYVHKTYKNKYTVSFNVGDHGTVKVTDIPDTAKTNEDFSKITVWQGSTYVATAGNKTSIRYDVTPEVGWEIDYIKMTVNGVTQRLDNKELALGKTLTTWMGPGASVRYNTDSNGNTQIRVLHVDADCTVKVYYRNNSHKIYINNQQKSQMRAEGYNTGIVTEFTDNFAVSTIQAGSTLARQNGIKYWLKPIDEKDAITSAVVEDSYGNYIVCGEGFQPTEYQDYKLKSGVIRYYQAADGKIEIRVWGVMGDIKITVFYNGEKPVKGIAIPSDIETYDVGIYEEGKDNQDIDIDVPVDPDKDDDQDKGLTAGQIAIIAGSATVTTGAAATYVTLRRKKKINLKKSK